MSGRSESDERLLRQYLRDLGDRQLLSAQAERQLGRTVAAGRRATAALLAGPPWSPSREALLDDVRAGERATTELVMANLGLVIAVAKRYRSAGQTLLDLIQEGNIGLLRSVEHYDAERGYRFSTCATWWIRQAVMRAIANDARTIRLPVHVGDQLVRLRAATADFERYRGRSPGTAELAEAVGLPVERLEQLFAFGVAPRSLDERVGPDEEIVLGDTVADPHAMSTEDAVIVTTTRRLASELLGRLAQREQLVLRLRFGLDGEEPATLAEVGAVLDLTGERVRQIERSAISKLQVAGRRHLLDGGPSGSG
ncbi:MAG TPA: sigma-70 family RNA polymerase sigma factor [Acidimicrobiales bacterium]|nr:sigma-70 family RNA polymerase sigma factor [Acidimicrobiales bacterium]